MSVFYLCDKSFNEDKNYHQCTIGTALIRPVHLCQQHCESDASTLKLASFLKMGNGLYEARAVKAGIEKKRKEGRRSCLNL
jgi:hypothetical protein